MTGEFHTFSQTGEKISEIWGKDDGGDWVASITAMKKEEMTVCLLAAVLRELQRIRSTLWDVKPDDSPPVSDRLFHGPAHGRFMALQTALGHVRINELDSMRLDFRIRHILRRSGLTWLDEITPERLKSVKGCGSVSIRKLMAWKSEWLSKTISETEKQPKT